LAADGIPFGPAPSALQFTFVTASQVSLVSRRSTCFHSINALPIFPEQQPNPVAETATARDFALRLAGSFAAHPLDWPQIGCHQTGDMI